MSLYVGVDPGAAGGIAWIAQNAACAIPMPSLPTGGGRRHVYNTVEIARILRGLRQNDVALVVIEQLAGMPPGTNAAAIRAAAAGPLLFEGICAALGLPFEFVSPQTWQRALLAMPKAAKSGPLDDPAAEAQRRSQARHERRRAIKAQSIITAQRLYPDVGLLPTERSRVASDGMAEALLLAEYARRRHSGGELFARASA